MSSSLPCTCPSPSSCCCPVSRWPVQFSNHYVSSYGPQLHPPADVTAFIPFTNPQWVPQPQQPYYAPQSQQLFTFPSVPPWLLPLEIPPPVINVTAPPPRKQKNTISSGSTAPAKKKRKPRASATTSATSRDVPPLTRANLWCRAISWTRAIRPRRETDFLLQLTFSHTTNSDNKILHNH